MSKFESRLAQARLSDDAGEADKDNAEDSWVFYTDVIHGHLYCN
jgi:hypothetical protein